MQDKNFCTIYIVRHGETIANAEDIVAGHFDSPLNEEGKQQAMLRADSLKDVIFDAAFSSDLIRAKETAEIIKLNRNLAVNANKLLREKYFGKFEGGPGEKYLSAIKLALDKLKTAGDQEKRKIKLDENFESDEEITGRMLTFLREAAVAYPGKTILIVSHGTMMRSLLVHLGWVAFDGLPTGSIKNAGYFVLQTDGVDFFIKETVGIEKTKITVEK